MVSSGITPRTREDGLPNGLHVIVHVLAGFGDPVRSRGHGFGPGLLQIVIDAVVPLSSCATWPMFTI